QTIGRAARNVAGKAILYADRITDSMQYAIDETARRREKQLAYNAEHGITPESVRKGISSAFDHVYEQKESAADAVAGPYGLHDRAGQEAFIHDPAKLHKHIEALRKKMLAAAGDLEFEEAARLRDEIRRLEEGELGL
ncbi:MAG: UvrB/UvrC motif-containing protein, partial [Alphaproteobacteria bacterium]|nr:UvrB/UvrC motif-containing protein [Alphaproteobacteria bacterium]